MNVAINRRTVSWFIKKIIYRKMGHVTITTKQGKIRGRSQVDYHGNGFYSFSGIPYAQAPIGELRFKPPQPWQPWKGTFDATKEGPPCPTIQFLFSYSIGEEDNCLNLNVYTHHTDGTKKVPVMLFIHGGGFIMGSNQSDIQGPHYLMTADIVLVVINYRLGAFGFLSMEDQSLGVPGNAGLKDQVMALRWVQENIESYGGDPDNVTVFGESAGGASVQYLMVSPLAKGLFHKAIIQSGSALNPWARGRRNALDIARSLRYTETEEKVIFDKLMVENPKALVKAVLGRADALFANRIRPFGPVIEYKHEGAFLTEDPMDLLRSGNYNKVPVIIGYNSLEGILFEALRKTMRIQLPTSLECDIFYNLNVPKNSELEKELAKKIREFYYGDEEISEKNIKQRYLIMTDTDFAYGVLASTKLMSQHQQIYAYRISLDGPLNLFKKMCMTKYSKPLLIMWVMAHITGSSLIQSLTRLIESRLVADDVKGAAHGDDLFFLFSTGIAPNIKRGSKEDEIVQRFVKIWTSFAARGDPLIECWKPVENGSFEPVLEINSEMQCTDNLDKERYLFWEGINNYCKSCKL